MWLSVQADGSKLNTSTSDTGVLASFFNSLLIRKNAGAAVGPDGKPTGNHSLQCTVLCYLAAVKTIPLNNVCVTIKKLYLAAKTLRFLPKRDYIMLGSLLS